MVYRLPYLFYCFFLMTLITFNNSLNAQVFFPGPSADGYTEADGLGANSDPDGTSDDEHMKMYEVRKAVRDFKDTHKGNPDALAGAVEGYLLSPPRPLTKGQERYLKNVIRKAQEGSGPMYYVNKVIAATGITAVREISDYLNNKGATNMYLDGLNPGFKGMIAVNWQKFLKSMQLFAGVIFIIVIGVRVFKLFLNPGQTIISHILIKPILILAALVLYVDLVNLLVFDSIEVIMTSVYPDYDQKSSTVVTGFSEIIETLNAGAEETNKSTNFFEFLKNQLIKGIFYVINLIVKVVVAYIYFLATCMAGIYFGIGPLALAMSLIPGNEAVLKKWFFGFYSYLLWQPVIILIMMITITSYSVILDLMGVNTPNALLSLCLAVGVIFFLLMTPKIASVLVSQAGEAGQGMISNAGDYSGQSARSTAKQVVFGKRK